MQTSTITVAVMDEAPSVAVAVEDKDLEITKYRGSGKGGQHRNKTDSAVRIRHKPTGIIVCSEQERSQHKNMAIARAELARRLEEQARGSQEQARAEVRNQQLGSGMRGDKRRTIRMQDDEVRDHRSGKTCRAREYLRGRLDLLSSASASSA